MPKFNKIAKLLPAEGDNTAVLVEAVKASEKLALNEDSTMLKRTDPLPEVDDYEERCLFVVCIHNLFPTNGYFSPGSQKIPTKSILPQSKNSLPSTEQS